jgi:hypothetical protein
MPRPAAPKNAPARPDPGPRRNLGGRRYQGCDTSKPESDSGMEQRLRLLLGIGGPVAGPQDAQPGRGKRKDYGNINAQRLQQLRDQMSASGQFIITSSKPGILGHLLRNGTVFANYAIGEQEDGLVPIRFRLDEDAAADPWPVVATAPDKAAAVTAVKRLIAHLLQMRDRAESVYEDEEMVLVEHQLLRPCRHAAGDIDPYQLSLVFPAWPVRFQRHEFRKFALRTAKDNCPAHLQLRCHWLGAGHMKQFKQLYRAWRACLADRHQASGSELDAAAAPLRTFLQSLDKGGKARP